MDAARDAGERDFVMQMRRCGDRHRIDAFGDQFVEVCEGAAARQFGCARSMRRQRIDDSDQGGIRQTGQHAGMVAAHDARADDADAKRTFGIGFRTRCGPLGTHIADLNHFAWQERPGVLLARRHTCGECRDVIPDTF